MSAANLPPEPSRPFDPDRYSPASVGLMLNLPASNARSFMVASALGWFKRGDGSSERLRSGKEAAGSLITPRRLPIVLDALGLSKRRWQQLVSDWVERYLAHRCSNGTVFLFTHLVPEECPACGAAIHVDHKPPTTRPNRGHGFSSKAKGSETLSAEVLRSERTSASHGGAQVLRSPATEATHLHTGLLPGEKEVSADICGCGHAESLHFVSGSCRRIGCECVEVTR